MVDLSRACSTADGGPIPLAPYVPSPPSVLHAVRELAALRPDDVLFDLGCGDARLLLTVIGEGAVRRGAGLELDPEQAARARAAIDAAGLSDRVAVIEGDILATDLSACTLTVSYLLFSGNLRLRPKLLRELAPGARVVSVRYGMGEWSADATRRVCVPTQEEATVMPVHRFVVPAGAGGDWTVRCGLGAGGAELNFPLRLRQSFTQCDGEALIDGASCNVSDGRLEGTRVTFRLNLPMAGSWRAVTFSGTVLGEHIGGEACVSGSGTEGVSWPWTAERPAVRPEGSWRWREEDEAEPLELRLARDDTRALHATLTRGGEVVSVPHIYLFGATLVLMLGEVERGVPSAVYAGTICEGHIEGYRHGELPVRKHWRAERQS